MVDHPPHYTAHPSGLECIEVTRLMPFTTGNAVKYVWRADLKNGTEDLHKARWYLRDHLKHGAAITPPWKARMLLQRVAAADTNAWRAQIFRHIGDGQLGEAIELLDSMIKRSKVANA